MRGREYLFHESDLSSALEAHGRKVQEKVDSLSRDRILTADIDDLVTEIVKEMSVESLLINENGMKHDKEEIKIDVAGWPDRFTWGNGPCLIPGIRVMVSLPFTGDSVLWRLRPNTFSSILPHGTVRGSVLEMTFECPVDVAGEKIKPELEENLKTIRAYVGWQKDTVAQFNAALDGRVRSAIQGRQQRLGKQDELEAILNIPVASAVDSSSSIRAEAKPLRERPHSQPSVTPQKTEAPVTWDVFISHASEDKDTFVRALATGLAGKGLKVWFDELTLTLGDSLRRSIDQGLANSRFGIVVLSHNFFAKEWPQKELDGLVAKEKSSEKTILPVWHGLTKDDVAKYSPLLADRVAVSSNRGINQIVKEILAAIQKKST